MAGEPIEAVLLDMGGVLIPEIRDFDGAARRPELCAELRALGVGEPEALIRSSGARLRDAYRALEAEHGQPDPEAVLDDLEADVRSRLVDAFAREETQPPFPWARETVGKLARRTRLGLVSNTVIPGDHHAEALARAGILEFIEAAVWSANFGSRKPGTAIIRHVLDALGVAPERALFVGDKIRTDVAGARRAGVRAVWLRNAGAEVTDEAEPDHVIEHLDQLSALLERLG